MHIDQVPTECFNSTDPIELTIMTATFSFLLLVIAVPSNLLVCLAVIIDPKKELRTQFNCFTFNLALADLLVGCVAEAVCVYGHINASMNSQFGHRVKRVMQKFIQIPFMISAVASALTIVALALERYVAITAPFRYRRYFDVKLSVGLSIVIWTIAVTFGLLSIFLDHTLICFIFVNSVLAFTCLAVCFAWVRIRSALRKASNNWAEIGMRSTREDELNIQKLLTKTFVIMKVALICCYVPVCGIVYYMHLCRHCNCDMVQWFRDAFFWLIAFNSAVNPFIYAFRNAAFRRAVKVIMKCECRKVRPALHQPFRDISYSWKDKRTSAPYQGRRQADGQSQLNKVYGSVSTST